MPRYLIPGTPSTFPNATCFWKGNFQSLLGDKKDYESSVTLRNYRKLLRLDQLTVQMDQFGLKNAIPEYVWIKSFKCHSQNRQWSTSSQGG